MTVEIESTVCEDYPCCGHGPPPQGDGGGCPVRYTDGTERYYCVGEGCGALMQPGATSALCLRCTQKIHLGEYEDFAGERDDW